MMRRKEKLLQKQVKPRQTTSHNMPHNGRSCMMRR
nr:MAG TPA_asm: hypothetical protein [Caudoviricetes sp.]